MTSLLRLRSLPTLALALGLAGCLSNSGAPPPEGQLLTPIAVALMPESVVGPGNPASHLYVLNSNFDLRYNSSSFQVYDLDVLDDAIDMHCVMPRGTMTEEECALDPDCPDADNCVIVPDQLDQVDDADGELTITSVSGLVVSEVRVGSYGSGITFSDDGTVAYLGIRSDASITRIEVDPVSGTLACGGAAGTVHRCNDASRTVDTSLTDFRDVDLPADPLALATAPLADIVPGQTGTAVFAAHREGAISFMIDRGNGLELVDALGELGREFVNIAYGPDQTLWTTSALSTEMARVGVASGGTPETALEDALLYDAGAVRISGIGGVDARDIQFDSNGNVLVLTRAPGALIFADQTPEADGTLPVVASVEVGAGPSRLHLATVAGREFAFVSCFDSRDMYVIDLVTRDLSAVIRGMSGPFDFAVDPARSRIYVGDFRTSVLRVVDLTPLENCISSSGTPGTQCAPEVIGLVGRPTSGPGLN